MRPTADPPQLRGVRLLWLPVADSVKFLLLEDEETGDVLLPLVYMKSVFEANYSRKLSSLKYRLVVVPSLQALGAESHEEADAKGLPDRELNRGFVYWHWAFESPHEVKVLVRQALGDPQGHLRLILLPIVYNAMAQKQKMRMSPFFKALHQAMQASSYSKLIKLPPDVEACLAEADRASLSLSLGPSESSSSASYAKIFSGPYDLAKTIAKYTLSYEAAEDSDISKRRCTAGGNKETAAVGGAVVGGVVGPPSASSLRKRAMEDGRQQDLKELQLQQKKIVGELHLLRKEYQSSMYDIEHELIQVREMVGDIARHLAKRGSEKQTQGQSRGHVFEKSLLEMRL